MTNQYKINLIQKAYGDLKDIYRYIKKGYRKLINNNYIALYLIDEDRKIVNIIRVVYGSCHVVEKHNL